VTPSLTTFDVAAIERNAEILLNRIVDAGGDLSRVRLMAVTKAFDAGAPNAAVAAGMLLLGESYVQEFVAKLDHVAEAALEAEWHFIGRLQRNKVRRLPECASVIQSVDNEALAAEIARRRPGQTVFVQANLGDEPQKGGCPMDGISTLVAKCRDLGLQVEGVMGVAEQAEPDVVLRQYQELASVADELELAERSMGMTGDLESAVAAGSTMVRIGTALFGSRPAKA